MKPYYTIVSIATKPQLNEKFNIALLCVTQNRVYFHFSEEKLKIVSKLVSPEARKLAKSMLLSIEVSTQDQNSDRTQLFDGGEQSSMVTESYLSYLNRYNNNLIQFTAPTPIDLDVTEEVFQALFKNYIYTEEVFELIQEIQPVSKIERFKNTIKRKAHKYVNIDYQVSDELIHGLIAPVTVDMFGKNGAYVTGQTIDFSKKSHLLLNDLNAYMYLALSTEMSDEKAKCFLLGEEPDKDNAKSHAIWNNVRKTDQVEFVPLQESERVIEYLKANGVEPVE